MPRNIERDCRYHSVDQILPEFKNQIAATPVALLLTLNTYIYIHLKGTGSSFHLLEQYELIRHQPEVDCTKNISIRMVVGSCRDIKYLSIISTNNLIIRI